MKKLVLVNKTRSKIPDLEFEKMKDAVLGKDYDLSIHIISSEEIKTLNKRYRNIDKATDILSFPVTDDMGEIFISPKETKEMAKEFDREYENFFAFIFIHGLVHLKGHDHGSTMDKIEKKYRSLFNI